MYALFQTEGGQKNLEIEFVVLVPGRTLDLTHIVRLRLIGAYGSNTLARLTAVEMDVKRLSGEPEPCDPNAAFIACEVTLTSSEGYGPHRPQGYIDELGLHEWRRVGPHDHELTLDKILSNQLGPPQRERYEGELTQADLHI